MGYGIPVRSQLQEKSFKKIIKPLTKVSRQHLKSFLKSYKHHEKNDGRLFVGTSASQPASTLRSIFGHEGHLSKEVAREAAQHLPDRWPGDPAKPDFIQV